jgi:hypothetical protein
LKSLLPFWVRLIFGVGLSLAAAVGLFIAPAGSERFFTMGLAVIAGVLLVESALQELRLDDLEKRLHREPPADNQTNAD